VAVSKVISAITDHGRTAAVKRGSGKKSALKEIDCHILKGVILKSYKIITAQVIEMNTVCTLKAVCPQRLFDMIFTNPASNVGL
jgi:hypothetical protein